MVRRIVLENFMSHGRTVIEPADGLTVLAGPNNCGKSAVVVALQALCYNDGHKSFIRHGEKEARVAVETDDGHKVEWISKAGVVRYRVNGREVDRLRGRVPDDLDEILRLPKVKDDKGEEFDIHFAEQKRPIFLLDSSGSKAATFFASSSDAGLLIQMQQRHKEKVRDARRDELDLDRRVKQGRETLARYEAVPKLDASVAVLEGRYEEISRRNQVSARMQENAIGIENCARKSAELAAQVRALSQLAPPPSLGDTASLGKSIQRLSALEKHAAQGKRFFTALCKLAEPPALQDCRPLDELHQNIARRAQYTSSLARKVEVVEALAPPPDLLSEVELRKVCQALRAFTESVRRASEEVASAKGELEQVRKAVDDHIRANPLCPTCGSKLKIDLLLAGGHVHAGV